MTLSVIDYVRADGSVPFQEWLRDQPTEARARVTRARGRLELGNTSALKRIGTICEYRIDWGPGYRIYLAHDGENIVILLGGGTKQRQQKDIERAKELWARGKVWR